jgi:hypothetical protein
MAPIFFDPIWVMLAQTLLRFCLLKDPLGASLLSAHPVP